MFDGWKKCVLICELKLIFCKLTPHKSSNHHLYKARNEEFDPMEYIVGFFESKFFTVFSGISILITIFIFMCGVYLVCSGVFPVLYRLGTALSRQKVAIFASYEFDGLKSMLVDSKLFKEKNIIRVNKTDIDKARVAKLFLVHWNEYQDVMNDIIQIKDDSTALIVYAPQNEGKIENQEILNTINSKRNSIIVNFRGRLSNDILISLITANY